MQRVAQDWLVLTQLSHDSGVAVGVITACQFAPTLLLIPVAGAIADRFDQRRILIVSITLEALIGLTLGVCVLAGWASLGLVYAVAIALGVVLAVENPTRHAFTAQLVVRENLANAVGLNSASFHAGRLIGPGLAGLLIHSYGTGLVFVGNGVATLVAAVAVWSTKPAPGPAREPRTAGQGHRDWVRVRAVISGDPRIWIPMLVVGLLGAFSLNFQLTTALMARLEFHQGAGQYGLLGSILAIGSLSGTLLAARRESPGVPLVLGACAAFGALTSVSSVMPGYLSFALSLPAVGMAALTVMTTANSCVQLAAPPDLRGRIMAIYLGVFMGGSMIGGPVLGAIGEFAGARWALRCGAGVSLLTAVAGTLLWLAASRRAVESGPADLPVESGPA
jgi:MFS family permease